MTKLYNANDGLTGRTGGPYLDIEQAKQAEIQRAKVEDREPNFDTMAASAGIQLVTAKHLINTVAGVNSPSNFDTNVSNEQDAVDAIVDGDNASTLKPFADLVVKESKAPKPKAPKSDDTATETK